jgi:glucose-1-phosphate adenylyltransferase
MANDSVATVILAGGKGTRLEPLTRDRAKPAVPFGGIYRIIDFTLSNCLNSGLRRVIVLTQFKSRSLDRHIRRGWNFLSPEMGEGIEVLPPQQRVGETWYRGTADAIYQNIYSLEKDAPADVVVLAGDHVYKMDYRDMVRAHRASGADLTIGCIPVPLDETDQFGIVAVDDANRVTSFTEKPATAPAMPGDPDNALGSMGIYVFKTGVLFDQLVEDAANPESAHDFGHNVIPAMLAGRFAVYGHMLRDENRKARPYWRDAGTLDAFYRANLDLIEVDPQLNLYDTDWPVRTVHTPAPPPKFVFQEPGRAGEVRRGEAHDSLVSPGCIISGGTVRRSILSPGVRVNSYATVDDSILFEGVDVGRHCRVRRAIIDKDVKLPPHTVLGYDSDFDRRRGFTVSEGGVVVVAKGEPAAAFLAPRDLQG